MPNLENITLKSPIKLIAVKLNMGSNLQDIAKEVGVNKKQLSDALKRAGYTYKEKKWLHFDYTDPVRELTIKDAIERIQVDATLRTELKKLEPYERITKRLAADSSTIEAFENFCDENGLMRPRALTLALREFIDKHSK